LAVNTPERRGQQDQYWMSALQSVRRTWDEANWIFSSSFSQYLPLVWNASFQDLYWANRFGEELYRFSLFLVPRDRFDEERQAEVARLQLIARHIQDFNNLARAVLLAPQKRKMRDEI
jgi:hypothetical protein